MMMPPVSFPPSPLVAVRFRAFSMRETVEVDGMVDGFFGKKPGKVTRRRYRTPDDLYRAVAAFASTVAVVSISGTPWSETYEAYASGDVVVWYYAGVRAATTTEEGECA